MAQLDTKIKLYATANNVTTVNFKTEVLLQDDGDGVVYIKEWNLSIAQPTAEQIALYETEATKIENNNVIISTRKQSYGTWQSQLEEIYDNGIDAWKTRIAKVKADNPKD